MYVMLQLVTVGETMSILYRLQTILVVHSTIFDETTLKQLQVLQTPLMHACMYVLYVCMYACMYVCMYVCSALITGGLA